MCLLLPCSAAVPVGGGVALPFGMKTIKEKRMQLRPTNQNFFSASKDDVDDEDVETAARSTQPPRVAAPQRRQPVAPPVQSPTRSAAKTHPGSPPCVASSDVGPPGAPGVAVSFYSVCQLTGASIPPKAMTQLSPSIPSPPCPFLPSLPFPPSPAPVLPFPSLTRKTP